MRKLLLLLIIGMFFISLTSAQIDTGTVKQNDCIDLYQSCPTCTYSDVRAIKYPNGSTDDSMDWTMVKNNSDYTYEFCNTSDLGDYTYTVYGNKGGLSYESTESGEFEVTKTGNEKLGSGEGNILFISLIIIIIISLVFFVLGLRAKNMIFAIIFLGLCGLFLFIASLFTMSLIENTLYQYTNIVEGYATYIMVIKVLVSMAMLSLCIYGGLVALELWKIKRGFRD